MSDLDFSNIIATGLLKVVPSFGPHEACQLELTQTRLRSKDSFTDVIASDLEQHAPTAPLAFTPSDHKGIKVFDLIDGLFSTRKDLREAVTEVLFSNLDRLTPRTQDLLIKSVGPLSDSPQWQRNALVLHKQASTDWLLNLAGLRCSANHKFDDGFELYSERVLYPSPHSIDSIVLDQWKESSVVPLELEDLSLPSLQFCYARHGFNPYSLSTDCSFCPKNAISSEILEECLIWAKSTGGKAQFLVNYWLLHYDELPAFASTEVQNYLEALFDNESSEAEELRQSQALAAHFVGVLSALWPAVDPDRICQLAWWMSGKVSETLHGLDYAEYLLQHLTDSRETTEYIRELLDDRTQFSGAFIDTLRDDNAWRLSSCDLLMRTRWTPIPSSDAYRQTALRLLVFLSLDDCPTASTGSACRKRATPWGGLEDYLHQTLRLDAGQLERMRVDNQLQDFLSRISELPEGDGLLVAHLVRRCCYLEPKSCELFPLLWSFLEDEAWRSKTFRRKGALSVISHLLDGFTTLCKRQIDPWRLVLAHVLAIEALALIDSFENSELERVYILCCGILKCTLGTSDFSAWSRLKERRELRPWVECRMKELENLLPFLSSKKPSYLGSVRLAGAKLGALWSIGDAYSNESSNTDSSMLLT